MGFSDSLENDFNLLQSSIEDLERSVKQKFLQEIKTLNLLLKAQETKIQEMTAKRLAPSLQEDFLLESLCINDSKEKLFLRELIGNKIQETVLLYRGSQDGWNASDFHSKCDS
jgi:hypothetical protein